MTRLKKILIGLVALIVTLAALFVIVIGPWPVYSDTKFLQSKYYHEAIKAIETETAKSPITEAPGRLKAGWAVRIMTPDVGVPMGGYSARTDGKKSQGVRDELMAKAISISDGVNTVVFLGLDMLIVPPNVAEMTIAKVAKETPLTANNVYFSASHTHCGPGAFAPGLASKISAGEYDPKVPEFLSSVFADAIVTAYNDMKPALIAHGHVNAQQYIRNRTRDGEVDRTLNYMIAQQEDGKQCYMVRFSAHPTLFDDDMMNFSASFPGEMARYIEQQTKATAIYLGGAVGSMSPRAPDAPSRTEKVAAFGQAVGKLLLDNIPEPDYQAYANVASVGVSVGVPPVQVRPPFPELAPLPRSGKTPERTA